MRVKSESIKLRLLDDLEFPVIGDIEWEGTVTDRYFVFHGQRRRLVANPSIDFWKGYGVWLLDCHVEIASAYLASNTPRRMDTD